MERSGNLNKSMRRNYDELGVDEYYKRVASDYRNPHFFAVQKCLDTWLDIWWRNEGVHITERNSIRILDLAAGSGEVTICILEWWRSRTSPVPNLDSNSSAVGARAMPIVERPAFIPYSKLRSQTQTLVLEAESLQPSITAVDPFTAEAYQERTGRLCHPLSFSDIAQGSWPTFPSNSGCASQIGEDTFRKNLDENIEEVGSPLNVSPVDMVICSFALHLVETSSELFALLWELSTRARWLIVVSPHKKPEIKDTWGWDLWDTQAWGLATSRGPAEILRDRVHCRIFRSANV